MQNNIVRGVIIAVVLAIIVFRNLRTQRMTVMRFWAIPALLGAMSVFVIYVSFQREPDPLASVFAALIGAAAGIPFGLGRGHHSNVRLAEEPHTFYIGPSPMAMLLWLAAFGVKEGLKVFAPHLDAGVFAVTDGILYFAISSVIVSRIVIFRKYLTLSRGRAIAA